MIHTNPVFCAIHFPTFNFVYCLTAPTGSNLLCWVPSYFNFVLQVEVQEGNVERFQSETVASAASSATMIIQQKLDPNVSLIRPGPLSNLILRCSCLIVTVISLLIMG